MSERVTKRVCQRPPALGKDDENNNNNTKSEPLFELVPRTETSLQHVPRDVVDHILVPLFELSALLAASSTCRAWHSKLRGAVYRKFVLCVDRAEKRSSRPDWDVDLIRIMRTDAFRFERVCCLRPVHLEWLADTISPHVKKVVLKKKKKTEGATEHGAAPHARLPNVESVTCSEGVWVDGSVPRPAIKTLKLNMSGVGEAAVDMDATFPCLSELVFSGNVSQSFEVSLKKLRLAFNPPGSKRRLRLGQNLTKLSVIHCPVKDLDLGRMPNLKMLECAPDAWMTDTEAARLMWPRGLERLVLRPLEDGSILGHRVCMRPVSANMSTPRYRAMTQLKHVEVRMPYLCNLGDLCLDSVEMFRVHDQCLGENFNVPRTAAESNAAAAPGEPRAFGTFDLSHRGDAAMSLVGMQFSRSHFRLTGRLPPTLKRFEMIDSTHYVNTVVVVSGLNGDSLPASLEHLSLPSSSWTNVLGGPSTPLSVNLPHLQQLVLPDHFNQPIEHVLATLVRCTMLKFGFSFNQPVAPGLAKMQCLKRLWFNGGFNQPLWKSLPPQLEVLVLRGDFDQDLSHTLPASLRILDIGLSSLSVKIEDDRGLPPGLERLYFPTTYAHDPSNLLSRNHPSLKVLSLPHQYEGPLPPDALPPQLEWLSLGDNYRPCCADVVPPGLEIISVGRRYEGDMRRLFAKLRQLKQLVMGQVDYRDKDWTDMQESDFPPALTSIIFRPGVEVHVPWHRLPALQRISGADWMEKSFHAAKMGQESMTMTMKKRGRKAIVDPEEDE